MRLRVLIAAAAIAVCEPALAQGQAAPVLPPAKNVIVMISDGQGFNGWMATDFFQHGAAGQQAYQQTRPDGTRPVFVGQATGSIVAANAAGDSVRNPNVLAAQDSKANDGLAFRVTPYDPARRWLGFDATFRELTDSAAAATALFTGAKTLNGRIAVRPDGREVVSIAEIADSLGKATGTVTSVTTSHATPAPFGAKDASRGSYAELFRQMANGHLDVIIGAGHPLFDADGKPRTPANEQAFQYVGGEELWNALRSPRGHNGFTFIDAKADFERLAAGGRAPAKLIGVPRVAETLQANRAGGSGGPADAPMLTEVPDLTTMALAALNVLDADPQGFVLMIEGGAVDWVNHANNGGRMLQEHGDFNNAVNAVVEWVEKNSSWSETLLIVTSDHETGAIWGPQAWVDGNGDRRFGPGDTFLAFQTPTNTGKGKPPGHSYASPNHTNDLVPMWALGPGAERFLDFTLRDARAAELWGSHFGGWTGGYVDNTTVFTVMQEAMTRRVR
jgi:alkaline phosphatase